MIRAARDQCSRAQTDDGAKHSGTEVNQSLHEMYFREKNHGIYLMKTYDASLNIERNTPFDDGDS